jgi:hypothetical protein
MFDSLTIPQTRPVVWFKRVLVFAIVALVTVEVMSGYRAYYQVRDLELSAPRTLSEGSIVNTSVVTSGRTWVDLELDLIQGEHSERLVALMVRKNHLGFFDPRTQQASETFTLTRETLSRFQPGRARLRSVATGRLQWTILPPPTVREIEVDITK